VETHRKALVAAQAAADLPLPDEAEQLKSSLEGLIRREIPARQSFVKQAAEIEEAIRGGDFDTARYLYKKVRDIDASGAGVLTSAEQTELNDLGVKIEDQQSRSRIAEIDARAARLIGEGQFIEARMELDRAIERIGPDPRLTKRQSDLKKRVDLEAAMREATGAEAAGDMAKAVAAYTRAHEIYPRPELDAKIKQIRSDLAFAEGQRLEAAGSAAAAAGKYQEAISYAPHAQAEARLREMKMADERSSILASAETAFAAGDFDRAITLYRKALELSPDPATQARVNDASVRSHVLKAEAHLRAGDLDKGRAELSNALAINPDDATAAQMMATLQTRARYLQLVAEADKLRADSQFGAAKATYQKAIDLARTAGIESKEIQERKFDTEFDHLIAQARSAMDLRLWVQARAFLLTARNMRPDDQRVTTLLAEVEANAPKEPR
jgi:tetratricopeptide (TPR) repeat protein